MFSKFLFNNLRKCVSPEGLNFYRYFCKYTVMMGRYFLWFKGGRKISLISFLEESIFVYIKTGLAVTDNSTPTNIKKTSRISHWSSFLYLSIPTPLVFPLKKGMKRGWKLQEGNPYRCAKITLFFHFPMKKSKILFSSFYSFG